MNSLLCLMQIFVFIILPSYRLPPAPHYYTSPGNTFIKIKNYNNEKTQKEKNKFSIQILP